MSTLASWSLRFLRPLFATLVIVGWSGTAIAAADPSGVSFTLEGCRNDGSITLPNGSGKFICPDAAYTTGNLGKGWNELDLVPHRLTAKAGNSAPASQTYAVATAADNCEHAAATGFTYADSLSGNPGTYEQNRAIARRNLMWGRKCPPLQPCTLNFCANRKQGRSVAPFA